MALEKIAPSKDLCLQAKELGLIQTGWSLTWIKPEYEISGKRKVVGSWHVVEGHTGKFNVSESCGAPSPDEMVEVLQRLELPWTVLQVNEKVSDQLLRFLIIGLQKGVNLNELIESIRHQS